MNHGMPYQDASFPVSPSSQDPSKQEQNSLASAVCAGRSQWHGYRPTGGYDEMVDEYGAGRPAAARLLALIQAMDREELAARQVASESAIRDAGGGERAAPGNLDRGFDSVPRIISYGEWQRIEAGLTQRVQALNQFIDDLYTGLNIVKDGVFPAELLAGLADFLPGCVGVKPPLGVWAHVCAVDLARDAAGVFHVLADNLRAAAGISRMLENRLLCERVFPEWFEVCEPLPVNEFPAQLYETLAAVSPRSGETPQIVVLTPSTYDHSYFEHACLARQMGCELVEAQDLAVGPDDCVYVQSTQGRPRVDVIYRSTLGARAEAKPESGDSLLGVPGLLRVWKAGRVALANAPGAGIADDMRVYAFMPDIIKYYLDQDPLIPNVPTFRCMDHLERDHVMANLDKLVVMPVTEPDRKGILIGPFASRAQREVYAGLIRENPCNYVAQPAFRLSTAPTMERGRLQARPVDLRAFVLSGRYGRVTAGGLTRVAPREHGPTRNGCHGGRSKDTWIVPGSY